VALRVQLTIQSLSTVNTIFFFFFFFFFFCLLSSNYKTLNVKEFSCYVKRDAEWEVTDRYFPREGLRLSGLPNADSIRQPHFSFSTSDLYILAMSVVISLCRFTITPLIFQSLLQSSNRPVSQILHPTLTFIQTGWGALRRISVPLRVSFD